MADLTQKNPFRRCVFVVALAAALAAWGCGKNPTSPPVIPPLAQLTLSPDTLTVSVGETGFFSVSALDSAGAPVTGFPATWSSSDSGGVIISLGRSGRVSALSEGTARVFVESGGLRDSGVVVIVPPQRGWFTQASNANGANLNGVFFQPDGRTGWVVGNGGKILGTTDAGARWSVQTSGTGFNLNGVWFNRDREGWAVGANGTVLHTTDGGAHWGRVNAGASENLMDVFFANDSMGWAVGSNGAILRTRNRGESWQKLHPTVVTLHGVAFADTTHGWAVGDYGTIVGTHNGGAGWFVVQPAVASQTHRGGRGLHRLAAPQRGRREPARRHALPHRFHRIRGRLEWHRRRAALGQRGSHLDRADREHPIPAQRRVLRGLRARLGGG